MTCLASKYTQPVFGISVLPTVINLSSTKGIPSAVHGMLLQMTAILREKSRYITAGLRQVTVQERQVWVRYTYTVIFILLTVRWTGERNVSGHL